MLIGRSLTLAWANLSIDLIDIDLFKYSILLNDEFAATWVQDVFEVSIDCRSKGWIIFPMSCHIPACTRHRPNAVPMLVHPLRRWPNIGNWYNIGYISRVC